MIPEIFSSNSVEEPIDAESVAGAASILIATGFGVTTGATGATGVVTWTPTWTPCASDSVSTASGVYSPVSSARARSDAV